MHIKPNFMVCKYSEKLFIGSAVAVLIVALLPMVDAGEPAIQHVVIIFKENHTFDDMFREEAE